MTTEPRCKACGTSHQIIYSGVDAFMLGVTDLVEQICYDCALTERNKVK